MFEFLAGIIVGGAMGMFIMALCVAAWLRRAGSGMMADILIWLIAAFGAVCGLVLGRLWGRAEGKRVGKLEGERDAMGDKIERTERGRVAVRDGRGSGDSADRLHNNDARW